MKRKTSLKYVEKDGIPSGDFVFYIDERVLRSNEPKFSPGLHWHDYFELEIVDEGEGTHYFNDKTFSLKRGSAFIVTPIDFHCVTFDKHKEVKLLHIQFDSFTMDDGVTKLITNSKPPITAEFSETEMVFIKMLCNKLIEEYNGESPDKNLMIKALLEQICISIIRKTVPVEVPAQSIACDETILQVVSFLNYNFRNKLTLKTISDRFFLNSNYLGEKFKRTLGVSFTDYVNDLRLSYAMKLLKNSDLSIKQISEESGFTSVSYFIKLFSEKYGSAPQKLRKMQ